MIVAMIETASERRRQPGEQPKTWTRPPAKLRGPNNDLTCQPPSG